MRRWFAPLAIGALALSLLSCGDDGPSDPGEEHPFPHQLPTPASMQLDTSHLDAGIAPADAGLCHALSATVVAWINFNVRYRLLIPAAALAACATQEPAYLGEQTWRWTASGGTGADAWTAELTGRIVSATEIDWEMRISGTRLAFERLLWFSGQCDPSAQTGTWHYYDPSSRDSPKELLRSEWLVFSGPELVASLEFRVVDPALEGYGDWLRYDLAMPEAQMSLFDASQNDTSWVAWDLETGEGSAAGPEGEICCWGEGPVYADIECP